MIISGSRVQPRSFDCGPAALRHAFLCYGKRVSVRRIARLANTKQDGTDEPGMMRAATLLGFKLTREIYETSGLVKMYLRNVTCPVLVCIDRWDHWVCVVSSNNRHVTIADGAVLPVVRKLTWRTFLSRAVMWHPGSTRFDLFPLRKAT